ncbi:hypothetical protein PAAG_06983 [Paracoccidioides lutzii Pb01]|uniref:Uncharacterized protein n=1 Tax=Paracoccidioides lutzii (strain ATCC MYA-826 / Pb01) TaxID=502779 RepID=C1H8I7_PARBA|nr:hypothetical protein PAAG_06983 [Paracoccidioides lutzii Pb01]EEH36565.1 hypothetical protein PAAG_06983 [Paracoccidioides lutzii Pb01]
METQKEAPGEGPAPKYRPAKSVPFQLHMHCTIYFEEKLFHQALHLLLSLLSSNTIASGPALIPSPQHLAVAATLIVHPSTTTRVKSLESVQVANTALELLRLTNKLVGPLAAKFDIAFAFTRFSSSRNGRQRRGDGHNDSANGSSSDFDAVPMRVDIARGGSLWFRSEDFWHAVGWAFNCAVLFPKRWSRWRVWLEFMCDVLEDDWAERERLANNSSDGTATPTAGHALLRDSLIFKYISGSSVVSGHHRRIMRAVFADGKPPSLNEFKEVFRNELKEPEKGKDNLKRREADVNVDEDEFGDYLSKDEDDDAEEEDNDSYTTRETEPSRPKRPRTRAPEFSLISTDDLNMDPSYSGSGVGHSGNVSQLGDLASLALRQRLMQLLSRVSNSLGNLYMELDKLYLLFVEFVRSLDLPTFQLLVSSPVLSSFTDDARTTLCEMILLRLLDNNPGSMEQYLSQAKLETCFLPYAAYTNSSVDNAKVSILLETTLRLLASNGMLHVRPSLQRAIEEGIVARSEKCQTDTRKSQGKQKMEESGWIWLVESGERMHYLVNKVMSKENEGKRT